MSDDDRRRGRGGFWNRAGRRSGGLPPRRLDVVLPFSCGNCATECWPGQLERRLLHVKGRTVEVALCPGCGYVVMSSEESPREADPGQGEGR